MYKNRRFLLPRIPFDPGDDDFPIKGFKRIQTPVCICFTITANKAQDQSFSGALGIDLRHECFTNGQLYVILSQITIQRFNPEQSNMFTKVVLSVLPGVSTADLDREPGPRLSRVQYLFLFDAPGGTGQTFVTTTIQRFLNNAGNASLHFLLPQLQLN